MVEKIGPIKNPLTIIAIFAAIAEISGTIVLPFIANANQAVYVWFLIIFPILLIVLFFSTLNFNHKVLYAPSDYQNEDNFVRSLPKASLTERVLKLEAEIAEEEKAAQNVSAYEQTTQNASVPEKAASDVPASEEEVENTSAAKNAAHEVPSSEKAPSVLVAPKDVQVSYQNLTRNSISARYMLAEDLVFRKLSSEFSSEIQRGVKIGPAHMVLDGIVREQGITTVVEVKFIRNGVISSMAIRETLYRIEHAVRRLPSEQGANARILLAIVSDEKNVRSDIVTRIDRLRPEFAFPIEVRFYNLSELERDALLPA